MYLDIATIKQNGKIYKRYLLRNSYRENGKVKHDTIANLSGCTEREINAIQFALKNKNNLDKLAVLDNVNAVLGKRIGGVFALHELAERSGLSKALGNDKQGRLALLQVLARVIDQGSRLSAVRFAKDHAVCEILGIRKLDEDDLYENLSWLAGKQEEIEKELFRQRFKDAPPTLFLYDVTSSYLEGEHNALARFGYNRDGKKKKMQIVVGMLAGPDGMPVAARVFTGNTNDTKTVSEQVRILTESFGVKEVTLVGDRGMLRGPQIEAMPDGFRYITAISKPQIEKMLTMGVLQMELFTESVCEVEVRGVRYVLRRNPIRALQIAETRESKLAAILKKAEEQTKHLEAHPKADATKALKRIEAKIKQLKADRWLFAKEESRNITIVKDDEALSHEALLDGCYAIKSDVSREAADAQTLHDRYCDLENVERAFRTMKTAHLELRPVYVHKEASTRGHVFVVMLALMLQRELESCWRDMDLTVEEGIGELDAVRTQIIQINDTEIFNIPTPTEQGRRLLAKLNVKLPSVLPGKTANVHTKKKLPAERKPA